MGTNHWLVSGAMTVVFKVVVICRLKFNRYWCKRPLMGKVRVCLSVDIEAASYLIFYSPMLEVIFFRKNYWDWFCQQQ
jgi:hypothetical protein